MSSRYSQISNSNQNVHFSHALMGEAESSRMVASPVHLTTFNAGDIVPIYCREILPDETLSIDVDFVVRQTTLLTPTMGNMRVDLFAFFVPNRIVNQSWKAVQGENYSGSWTANNVSLAPLVASNGENVQIPVGSVADYYGFPTQRPIPKAVLNMCHDLKFRGYVMIWNEHFRDQNYQPPIPLSTLNVYQGFLDSSDTRIGITQADQDPVTIPPNVDSDGSYGLGAVSEALYGAGHPGNTGSIPARSGVNPIGSFRAIFPPLKANKLHDYFTSVLPSPQKSTSSVFAPASGTISSVPVVTGPVHSVSGQRAVLFSVEGGGAISSGTIPVLGSEGSLNTSSKIGSSPASGLVPSNLQTASGATVTGLGISVDDFRMAASIQQVYEILARGGSRYREYISSFFGISVDDPFSDVPQCLGKVSRDLDLFQTAQTAASSSGSTPQGNLAAFGYTNSSGSLFKDHKFVEHGYLHIFAVVRHRNIYSSYMARDNFRLNMLDFYVPQLANISEQPVYTREINPFVSDSSAVFGYQEAWAEYRYEPDQVSGLMRSSVSESLSLWNYSDLFDPSLTIANANWLKSNSQEVLDKTLAVQSSVAPQFKGQFRFKVDKVLPMPTYSVPGLDII